MSVVKGFSHAIYTCAKALTCTVTRTATTNKLFTYPEWPLYNVKRMPAEVE